MDYQQAKIDRSHADLIYGLIVSRKPKTILELGFGTGYSANKILEGIAYNQNNPRYVVVDNWLDFNYQKPPHATAMEGYMELITSDEGEFVKSCEDEFDFILSDADHQHTDQWFDLVYEKLLGRNGILIYHDVDTIWQTYPNLLTILDRCKSRKLSHFLFNYDSLLSERCERGLLVIFKS